MFHVDIYGNLWLKFKEFNTNARYLDKIYLIIQQMFMAHLQCATYLILDTRRQYNN